MNRKLFHYGAAASLVALILLTLAWELWLAPVRPGGSFLALKAVILLAPLMGILKERLYTYQWSSMFILAFFTEGIMRSWGTAACRKPWPCGKWQSAWCSLAACWVLPVLSSANRPELSCRKLTKQNLPLAGFVFLNPKQMRKMRRKFGWYFKVKILTDLNILSP
jgi:hypothetical protein